MDEDESEGSWWCWESIDWGCIPNTLGNQRVGYRLIGQYDPDPEFEIHINEDKNWHLGVNGNPGRDEFDLVSTILHEIGHAVGFSSGFSVDHDEETGRSIWADEIYSMYYGQFVWSRFEGDLLDLPSPSEDLYDALTGNRLFWGRSGMENWHGESLLSVRRNGGPVMLWAAAATTTLDSGRVSAGSHLDPDVFPRTTHRDGLMAPYTLRGQANHRIGPVTLGMLYDLGWTLKGYRGGEDSPDINPDAAEGWTHLRMIGSEDSERGIPHVGVLLHATGGSNGLFGLDTEIQFEPRIRLLHVDPLDPRTKDIHMKVIGRWIPYLRISEKNHPEEGFEEMGLEYSTTVELTDSALEAFMQARDTIELHIHFEGDSRRTVLTFPLREPIN